MGLWILLNLFGVVVGVWWVLLFISMVVSVVVRLLGLFVFMVLLFGN